MPIKRPITTTAPLKTKRDWPRSLAHLAYLCAGLALVLVFVQFNLYCWHFNRIYDSTVESAVMLSNGQTYFGRLEKYGPNTLVLFDVYYLQAGTADSANPDASADTGADVTTNAASNIKLMKLENDFYQPSDYLIISRDQVLYWQHLKSNSPILEAIGQYEQQKSQQ